MRPPQRYTPIGVQPNIIPRPPQFQQTRPWEVVNRGPLHWAQTNPSVPKAAEQHSAGHLPRPVTVLPNPNTAPKQAGPICFRCGKAGHLSCDCKLGKPCAAAACVTKDEEAIPNEEGPKGEDQEENALVNRVEHKDAPLKGNQYLDESVEDDGTQGLPYPWDDQPDEQVHPAAPSIKMGAIHISNWRYG